MDLLNTDIIYFNNKEYVMAIYNGKIVWTAARGEFLKDFKYLTEDDDFEGLYDGTKLII